jgi:hypothetical protein
VLLCPSILATSHSPPRLATPSVPARVPPALPAYAYVQGRVQGPV